MSTICIADSSGHQNAYTEEQARALWQQGAIPRNAHYWIEGMAQWAPAVEFFEAGTAQARASSAAVPRGFVRDPAALTGFSVVMLWIYLAGACIAALISAASLLTGNAARSIEEELTTIDAVQAIFGLGQLVVFIVTGVAVLRWIHRANLNARGLGAGDMRFTPGWAVGWYFIPIANLWKPLQAMREIWHASANPHAAGSAGPTPPLLGAWWALWLISNFLGQLSLRLAFRGEGMAVMSESVGLLSDLVDIPLSLVFMKMIKTIHARQREWTARPAGVRI
jgi:hypothetical protein